MSYFDPHDKDEEKALLGATLLLTVLGVWLWQQWMGR